MNLVRDTSHLEMTRAGRSGCILVHEAGRNTVNLNFTPDPETEGQEQAGRRSTIHRLRHSKTAFLRANALHGDGWESQQSPSNNSARV
jgi:hypothetical protein